MPKYKGRRKSGGKKAPVFKGRKKTVVSNNFASVVETVSLTDICGNTPYSFSVALSYFDRASAVALQYQEYRIVKTEYRLMADDNMYMNNGTDGTMPYIYSIPNNGGETPLNMNVPWLEQNGAKPRKLTSIVKWSPKPRVQYASSSNNVTAMTKTSPWIRTINNTGPPSTVDTVPHMGLFMYVFQKTAGTGELFCELDCTVTIQFRKPLAVYNNSGPATQIPVPK